MTDVVVIAPEGELEPETPVIEGEVIAAATEAEAEAAVEIAAIEADAAVEIATVQADAATEQTEALAEAAGAQSELEECRIQIATLQEQMLTLSEQVALLTPAQSELSETNLPEPAASDPTPDNPESPETAPQVVEPEKRRRALRWI